MTPSDFYKSVLVPAAEAFQPAAFDSIEARCMLLAIAGQESGWSERIQQPIGYARGFWQCEEYGAVAGVLSAVPSKMADICAKCAVPPDRATVFEAIAYHDGLAYAVARLALWLDPPRLPAVGDALASYGTYIRVWRPGAPSASRWATIYPQAVAVIRATP